MGRYFSSCSHVLTMIVHVQISVALFLNKCPEKLMWTIRAKQLCGVEDKYMCLYDTNERSFRELCKESPEFHRPGNIFVISGNLQYFAGRPCYANRYQPHKWWTNGSSECQYLKSSCDGEGQVPYDNGTISRDRKCRCDYTSYYTFVNRTRNKCHCDPIEEDCSCFRKGCTEDQVLTPDYDCVGIHDWTGQFVCPEYKHPKNTDDKKLPQPTICPNIKKDSSGTIQQSSTRIAVSLISGALVILSLIVIIRNASEEDIVEVKAEMNADKEKIEQKLLKLEREQRDVIPSFIRELIRKQIENWEEKDKMFVPTKASDCVMKYLENNSCLTLTAPSGAGKSFIARHTALGLQKKGYKIIPVTKPDDIRNYYQPGAQTVFIVDDFCGDFTANQHQIDNWKQLLPVINTIIADKCCKIIVSCRLQVYKDEKFDILVPFKSCECNLLSSELCLTYEEKKNIAKSHQVTSMHEDLLLQNMEFFPLLCSLHNGDYIEDVTEFFKDPFSFYQNYLDTLIDKDDEGKYKICSLALCVLFNNQLEEKWFQGRVTDEQRHIIEDIYSVCTINIKTPKAKLKNTLDTLEGTFMCKLNGIYRILHDKLFDFIAYYFGQKMIKCLIYHGDSRLVHKRFIWGKSLHGSNIEFMIEIPDNYLPSYLERFIKDWSAGKVSVVFGNNNMKVPSFRGKLLQHLQRLEKSKQETLSNTKDTVIPKGEFGSSTTPLLWNCHDGYIDMIQWMFCNDVDVDQCRDDGVSGLIMASQEAHTDIVNLLLQRNSNVDICTIDGYSPLYIASQHGHTNIVKLLLEFDSYVDTCTNDGCTPLYIASQHGHTDTVKLLLEKDPFVNLRANDGCTPLYIASQHGHTDIVKLLLEKDPFVNRRNYDGCTPLYIASQNGHTHIVKLLLEKNPDVNLCTNDGCTPLYIASQHGHTDIVKLLLEKNSDVNLCTKYGYTPLDIAVYHNRTDIVRLLLKRHRNV